MKVRAWRTTARDHDRHGPRRLADRPNVAAGDALGEGGVERASTAPVPEQVPIAACGG
ncbi:hypothetical protein AB0H12_39615 [Actinosynnema sp. NPDC023794]